jgi:hypothetical protein
VCESLTRWPVSVIELDGCVVEPAEDGFVSLFERRIGRAQPHRYVILSHDPEVRRSSPAHTPMTTVMMVTAMMMTMHTR